MKRKHIILTAACAAIAFSGVFQGCGKKPAGTEEEVPQVSVAAPMTDSVVLRQSYPATLSATQSADVVARVDGQILQILFTEGDFVKAGQPLFTIESTTYRDAVNQAQAALETAIAENEYAFKQCEAMKKALEADAVSKMDVIQAESNLRQSEASIKQARAQLETAKTKLGYCTVRAPFSGLITESMYSSGAYVGGEAAPVTLATIYANNTIYAMFSVSTERYMQVADTRGGKNLDLDHVPVIVGDTTSTVTYEGKLDYASPDVSKSTGTVTLRLILDNPKGELRDGMFATVKLPYAIDSRALLVKDASISTDQLGKYLYVVNDSDKIIYTPIEVGDLYDDTLRIVTKGLRPDDRYVTTALLKVRDGMKVKPIK